ncbi:MAG: LEA type 2 family protein [Oligoflexales bacterium]
MKDLIWKIAFVFYALGAAGCSVLKQGIEQLIEPPVVTVVDVQPQAVSLSGLKLLFHVSIQNPNAFEIFASNLTCRLYAQGHTLAESRHTEQVQISSKETKTFPFLVEVSPSLVIKVFKGWMFSQKHLELTWSLETHIEAFLMSLPIERSGKVIVPAV